MGGAGVSLSNAPWPAPLPLLTAHAGVGGTAPWAGVPRRARSLHGAARLSRDTPLAVERLVRDELWCSGR